MSRLSRKPVSGRSRHDISIPVNRKYSLSDIRFQGSIITSTRRRSPSNLTVAAHTARFFSGQNPCRMAMRSVILPDAPAWEANRSFLHLPDTDTVMSSPQLVLIGGPNGAGKSTAAPQLLRDTLDVAEFVNADTIASGLSGFHPESAALQAGRVMLARLRDLASKRADFAFESTLASRSFAPWIRRLKQIGYVFHLTFLWLPDPDIAVARVATRVRDGGHDIPDATVRRRYYSGLCNFFRLYRPIADHWRFYDNTGTSGPRLISTGSGTVDLEIRDLRLWTHITKGV